MDKAQSKYFNSARLMDEALLCLLEKKSIDFISVKEICKKAGVNRSTFYLHYDNIADLLQETLEYINDLFYSKFSKRGIENIKIENSDKDNLVFITPQYLVPYLEFVKENKNIFKTIHKHPKLFESEKTFERLSEKIFIPVLKKFNLDKEKGQYVFQFYMKGVLSIVYKWVELDCKDDIETIVNIIIDCVNYKKSKVNNEDN